MSDSIDTDLANRMRATRIPPNPSGLCMCGCGEKTDVAKFNDAHHGWVRGEHKRYINHHHRRGQPGASRPTPNDQRYRIEDCGYETPCWVWQMHIQRPEGYGRMTAGPGSGGRLIYAHRYFYEAYVGPIPQGLQIDHLCRNRACVNPAHLEPVTQRENIQRGFRDRRAA